MFHKKELYGHWFTETEDTTGYTEKVPPDTAHVFDEESGDWVLSEVVEDEAEGD